MTDEALFTKICDKDVFLESEINIDATYSVIKSRTSKRCTWIPNFKNVMIKCSPQIRKHIMKDNDGCAYMRLSRCKSLYHFFVPQCYHSYKFNPISLMNAQIRICQLSEANMLECTKLKIVTETLWRSVLIAYKIMRETSNIMTFLVNVRLW